MAGRARPPWRNPVKTKGLHHLCLHHLPSFGGTVSLAIRARSDMAADIAESRNEVHSGIIAEVLPVSADYSAKGETNAMQ